MKKITPKSSLLMTPLNATSELTRENNGNVTPVFQSRVFNELDPLNTPSSASSESTFMESTKEDRELIIPEFYHNRRNGNNGRRGNPHIM